MSRVDQGDRERIIRGMNASYQALTTGCGVADLSSRSRVWITGADRVQFLHSFCTNDIKRLAVGEVNLLSGTSPDPIAHVTSTYSIPNV